MNPQNLQLEFDRTCKGKTVARVLVENDGAEVVLFFTDGTKMGLSAQQIAGQPLISLCELEPDPEEA